MRIASEHSSSSELKSVTLNIHMRKIPNYLNFTLLVQETTKGRMFPLNVSSPLQEHPSGEFEGLYCTLIELLPPHEVVTRSMENKIK